MILRSIELRDLESLFAISIATGLHGGNASQLYADQRLIGQIYSAPYCVLLPEFGLVVEEESAVVGFAVGAPNTRKWEARLEKEWWPSLRRRYNSPDQRQKETWSADERRIDMIHNPGLVPQVVVAQFPAHMHMNLLPCIQRRGVGRQLFEKWKTAAIDRGVSAVHVGANRGNSAALHFWHALGFKEVSIPGQGGERTAWFGRFIQ